MLFCLHSAYTAKKVFLKLALTTAQSLIFLGAPCPTRTDHLLITNQLLYQMS